MKKRMSKKDKKNSFIKIFSIVLVIALGFMLKTVASAATFERTYVLRVATGIADGSCIGFFGIEYKGEDGKIYMQYIFPHDGDYASGYENIIATGNFFEQSRRERVTELGYYFDAWNDVDSKGTMETYSEDLFFFQIPSYDSDIASIQNIYVYTDILAGTTQSWNCTSLELYQVKELNGRGMYGYVSKDQYLSFSGKLMASLVEPETFSTAKDEIYRLSPNSEQYKLNTEIKDYQDISATTNCEYIFKLDIADVYGGGIENFVNNKAVNIREMRFAEVLNLEVIYKCTNGRTQIVNIPVITSAHANAIANCDPETKLVDFAGQGESLVVPANLPYFEDLVSVKLKYGPEAMDVSGLKEKTDGLGILQDTIGGGTTRTTQRKNIENNNDTIYLTGVSIYKSGDKASKLSYEVQDNTILVPKVSGTPLYYYTASTYRGVEVGVNKEVTVTMQRYEEGARLTPQNNQARYLIVVDTDSVSTSVSRRIVPDITMKLTYRSTTGLTVETDTYSLKDLTGEYYGYTPNKAGNDWAYEMNVAGGQRLFAIVSLSGVEQFTSVSFGLTDQDQEWQLSNFAIYRIDEISNRHAKWIEEKTVFGQKVYLSYYRELNGTNEMLPKSAELYNAAVKVFVQNTEVQTIDFASLTVTEVERAFDWMAVDKYSLEYKNADAGYLGFYNASTDYQIDVKVADNSTNTLEDGDSGSKNYFYFQLVFQNGTSAVVQANQMLAADGFLTGQIATFQISTNYDYGDVVAVRIIPDDFTAKADPYDKLNIEYINVTKKAKSGSSTVWTLGNVGWVGIDYKDDGQESGSKTQTGRKLEDLAYTYNVTGVSVGVELEFALTTGTLPINTTGKQFIGSIMADIEYVDSYGGYKTVNFDVVQAMYNYANKTANRNAGNGKRQSDLEFMFLENRTNRFTYFLSDVSELVGIRLYVYSDTEAKLNISNISASLVVQEGPLGINAWGEYEKKSILFPITKNSIPISIFDIGASYTIYSNIPFLAVEKGMLTGLVNGTWPYDVKSEISISEDYLNINVYPKETVLEARNLVTNVILDYSDSYGKTYRVQERLKIKRTDEGTFYYGIDGVRVSDFSAIKEVKIEKVSGTEDMEVGNVVVQKIQDGQIIQTNLYDFDGKKASEAPTGTNTKETGDTGERQKVILAFEKEMQESILEADTRDIAIALHYTSSYDPQGEVYISPYMYLSDSKIESIAGGQIVELEFAIQNVGKITGISVAATGGLSVITDHAIVASYQKVSGITKLVNWYSIRKGGSIENESKFFKVTTDQMNDTDVLVPINMELTTGTVSGQNTGTDAAIRMQIDYIGFDDLRYTTEIEDIRKYTISGNYSTGSTATLRMILPNIKEIIFATFEPYDENESMMESWKLGSVALSYGVESNVKSANITMTETQAFAYESIPARVAFKKILVNMWYRLSDQEASILVQNVDGGGILDINQEMYITVAVQNSEYGSSVAVYELIDNNRRDVTSEYLYETSETGEYIFMVPEGAIKENTVFEIVATSKELSEFKTSFTVVVKTEEDIDLKQEFVPENEDGTDNLPESGNEDGTENLPEGGSEDGTDDLPESENEDGTDNLPEAGTE